MSYTINAYVVAIQRLRELIGSKDQGLYKRVLSARANVIADHNENLAEEIRKGVPPLEQALMFVIDGVSVPAAHAFQCWLAIELLVDHLGQRIMVPAFVGIDTGYLHEVDRVLTESLRIPQRFALTSLLERTPPLGLTAPRGFPSIGFLAAAECADLVKTLDGIDADDLEGNEEVVQGVADYMNMVDEAVASAVDVLLFYY